jgi:endonuclease-3
MAKQTHQRPETAAALQRRVLSTLEYLEAATRSLPRPMGELLIEAYERDPFILLISCLLSLRARDQTVYPVCQRLFALARTPQELLSIPREQLEALLKPIGFYRVKAKTIRHVAHILIEKYGGSVPTTEEELRAIPGVGLKTAHFMLAYAFSVPALCVDTHVHRLANLWGWVHTKTPEETERALRNIVPHSWWLRCNTLLVTWGQQVCKPQLARRSFEDHLQHCPCAQSFSPE